MPARWVHRLVLVCAGSLSCVAHAQLSGVGIEAGTGNDVDVIGLRITSSNLYEWSSQS